MTARSGGSGAAGRGGRGGVAGVGGGTVCVWRGGAWHGVAGGRGMGGAQLSEGISKGTAESKLVLIPLAGGGGRGVEPSAGAFTNTKNTKKTVAPKKAVTPQ